MRARRFLAVPILALVAGAAAAGEARASLTVGARVVRSAAVSVQVDAGAARGRIHIAARAGRAADRPMGIAVSAAGDTGPADVLASPLSAEVALPRKRPGAIFVTVLPDGRPPAVRFEGAIADGG